MKSFKLKKKNKKQQQEFEDFRMQLAGSDPVKDTEMANLKQPLIVFNKK